MLLHSLEKLWWTWEQNLWRRLLHHLVCMTSQHSPTCPCTGDWWGCLLVFLIWAHPGRWSLAKIEDLRRISYLALLDQSRIKRTEMHLLFLQLGIFQRQYSLLIQFPWSSLSKLGRRWSRLHWPWHLWRIEEPGPYNSPSLLLPYISLWGNQMDPFCLESGKQFFRLNPKRIL